MTTPSEFYNKGFRAGAAWIGPNGDGTMGALSGEFIRENAERKACGYRFAELTDGPDQTEIELARRYMRGFWEGWRSTKTA